MLLTKSRVQFPELRQTNYVPYFWVGHFQKGVPDRELFGQCVDFILTLNPTMPERKTAAEDFSAYYEQITGDKPSDFDFKRLFDWIREGYDPVASTYYSEDELKRRTEKYEKMTPDASWAKDVKNKVKRKPGMVVFSLGGKESEDDLLDGNIAQHKINFIKFGKNLERKSTYNQFLSGKSNGLFSVNIRSGQKTIYDETKYAEVFS